MNKKYLTKEDISFITSLKEDCYNRKERSFLSILFSTDLIDMNRFKKDLLDNAEDLFDFFSESDVIFFTNGAFYLGKYKEDFWLYSSEGELWGAGKQIQNTCNIIRMNEFAPLEYKGDINDKLKRDGLPDYDSIINEYKLFCLEKGMIFNESDEDWAIESADFNKMIYEKYGME